MATERKQVLEMLAHGDISVNETERLLEALGGSEADAPAGSTEKRANTGGPKFLRVVVEPNPDAGDSAPQERVNIRVPFAIIRAGIKLTSLIPDDAREHIDEALSSKGIDFDVKSINSASLSELIDALADLEIDVSDEEHSVRIYME